MVVLEVREMTMKMPIPDDWNGVDWAMWAVCWPDSSQWNGILQGQLTDPSKGFFWDGQTGSIIDAQDVGYEISGDNVPLRGCLVRCDTQLNDLIDAIASISAGTGGGICNCPGGFGQGSSNGTEGGVAPQNFVDPPTAPGTPEYDERKCKIANLNHEQVMDWLDSWIVNGVDSYIGRGIVGAATFILLTTILGTLMGEMTTPFPFIDALAGGVVAFIASIATVILAESFSLTTLIALMNANEDDLVCALYLATSAQEAQDDYIQVLDDAGAAAGALLLLQVIFTVDTLNALFFGSEDNPALEIALVGYTPPIPCNCVCAGWDLLNGTLSSGSLTDGNPFSIDAAWNTSGGCNRWQVQVRIKVEGCFYDVTHAAPGITSKCCGSAPCFAYAYTDEFLVEQLLDPYVAETVCMGYTPGTIGLVVRGVNAFTLNVSYVEGCP